MRYIKFLLLGILFGIILVKAEVLAWFRIQEMFRFQAFHMYGIIGSAIAVGLVSILLIKKLNIKTLSGQQVVIEPKEFTKGNIIGGFIFGLGWAITGACPGPLYALVGSGYSIILVTLISAVLGVFVYGLIKHKLPH